MDIGKGAGVETFSEDGIVWFRDAADALVLSQIEECLRISNEPGKRLEINNAFRSAITFADELAQRMLPGARAVRALYFDKNETSNWVIGWHQDRVIAVRQRVVIDGFTNWTRKEGIWHVEPPLHLLARMIFLRVHLDDTNSKNGCLQIALHSHQRGKIDAAEAFGVAHSCRVEDCVAKRGDVLAGQALILHRSGPSYSITRRRALRIDYSAECLPAPLEWMF